MGIYPLPSGLEARGLVSKMPAHVMCCGLDFWQNRSATHPPAGGSGLLPSRCIKVVLAFNHLFSVK
jgi:hypothetical protein